MGDGPMSPQPLCDLCTATGYIGHKRCAARCHHHFSNSEDGGYYDYYKGASPCTEDHLKKTCSGLCGCAGHMCNKCGCAEAPICKGGLLKSLRDTLVLPILSCYLDTFVLATTSFCAFVFTVCNLFTPFFPLA